jgi:hypothetical protein
MQRPVPHRIPPPKEPNGCLQAALISRMIARILFVPMLLIVGGGGCVVLGIYAFGVSMWLGFGLILVAIIVLIVISKWEYQRAKRDLPPVDDRGRIDPRSR